MVDKEKLSEAQKELVDHLSEYENEGALYADGLEEAFIGIVYRHAMPPVAGYDISKCIEVLMRDGMTHEEAWEYFGFNTLSAYVGESTPTFITFVSGAEPHSFSQAEIDEFEAKEAKAKAKEAEVEENSE